MQLVLYRIIVIVRQGDISVFWQIVNSKTGKMLTVRQAKWRDRDRQNNINETGKMVTGTESRAGNLLIHSFRSNQMSDCEQFAQIAQNK